MNRAIIFFLVVASLVALFWVKQQRQSQTTAVDEEPTKQPKVLNQQERDQRFLITVTTARRGHWPITITVFNDEGQQLSTQKYVQEKTPVAFNEGATKYKIESPGHRSIVRPWPKENNILIHLKAQGDDDLIFTQTPQNPETEGQLECYVRISDSKSGALLAKVGLFLDGQRVTQSSADGEASISFEDLRQAEVLLLKLSGYHDKKIELKPGKIDELQVEPLLMDKK